MSLLVLLLAALSLGLNTGRAPYGIENRTFPCDKFMATFRGKQKIRISYLNKSFRYGPGATCLDRVMKDRRLDLIHASLGNETCVWRGDCSSRDTFHHLSIAQFKRGMAKPGSPVRRRYAKDAASGIRRILNALPAGRTCLLTPLLESRLRGDTARSIIAETKALAQGRCLVGWNAIHANAGKWGQEFNEIHIPGAQVEAPCIFNNDGFTLDWKNPGLIDWHMGEYSHCMANFLWTGEDNCGGPRAGAPALRICKPGNWSSLRRYLQ